MVSRELRKAIRTLRPGDHVCFVRANEDESLPFIVDSLHRNELCCYLGERQRISGTKALKESPQLELLFLDKMGVDCDHLMRTWESLTQKAEDRGLSGIRIVQEMSWITQKVPGWEKYTEYESKIGFLCSERKISCICLYDRNFSADILMLALKTHPLAIVEDLLCRNFYYARELSSDAVVATYFENLMGAQRLERNLKEAAWKKRRQLVLSEKKYRALVEGVPDILYSLDSKGHLIEINPAITQILGFSRAEILGENFSKVVHPEDLERAQQSFEELVKGKKEKTIGLQLRLVTKEGAIKTGELNARAVYDEDGTFLRTEGSVRDITERKEQEQKLEFLAGVVENAMEAVVITERKGVITYVNPTACSMFQYSEKELAGQLANILSSKNSPVTFQEIIRKGDWEGEMLAIRKNGEKFPLWLRISTLRNGKKEITAFVSVSRDISEQKEAEEKLQRYALLLEMKVREKTRGTETLLKTSYALRSTSDWKKGADIITKGIVEGLGFERAAVFFVNENDKVLECRGQLNISDAFLRLRVSLGDERYAVVKCVKKKRSILVKDGLSDPQVGAHLEEEAKEVVWVPILFQEDVLGALGADRKWSQKPIEPEDVDMLELYANQIAEFIERTRLVVEPEVEKQVSTPLKYDLELREVYLIEEEKPEKAYDVFADLVRHGFKGFGICRTHPQKVREKYALEKTPMMWLSEIETKQLEHVGPQDIPKLVYLVAEFIKRAQPAVVIVEGVEYLIVQNDFKSVLKFLHTLSDYVATSESILLLSLNPGVLSAHQHVMLKRAFRTVPETR